MPRYAIDLEFDGRRFNGTQAQAAGRTLQQDLHAALRTLDPEAGVPRPASRLDAGVSAEHLPCHATLTRAWPPATLAAALAASLPPDLVALRAAEVADDWSAQTAAIAKTYRYEIALRPTRPVLDARACWVKRLDHVDRLAPMAALLPGQRDLSGFATLRHDDSDGDDPVRTVLSAEWSSEMRPLGRYLVFRITGAGFLYRQVRGLVGAMLHVARGKCGIDGFAAAIQAGRAAQRLGNVAPAHGLVLERVAYEPEPAWEEPSVIGSAPRVAAEQP